MAVSREEDDLRHDAYEADLLRRITARWPGVDASVTIDRRTDAPVTVRASDESIEGAVWELSQEAWQAACELPLADPDAQVAP